MEFCWFLCSVKFGVRSLGRFLGRGICLWLQWSQGSRVFRKTGTFPRICCLSRYRYCRGVSV